ncbi:YkgJ family cysteine cluster protein [Halopseudomonas pachastrellae]|nr:YkgJ family cysteine cluster protein [Halopseudomonas pachastrellae]HIQ52645.1 YkgJ family cysteine cluster protein [Halopseudomonas pachastrellae]
MECRAECGACCTAPSITSPIPGMPGGKPAGVPCVQLLADMRCAIFGSPERPAVCAGFLPEESVCGQSRADALRIIGWLESETGVGTAC